MVLYHILVGCPCCLLCYQSRYELLKLSNYNDDGSQQTCLLNKWICVLSDSRSSISSIAKWNWILIDSIPSSETQGQSVGSGERARRKFSSTGKRAPGYRLSPNYFQKFKRMPAPDWAQKILCNIVSNRRTVSPEFFSWVRTRQLLFRSRLVWLVHQRNARSQETFRLI